MARSVIFVGKADCLELHIDAQATFDNVLQEVNRKLDESGSFFAGARSIYVVGKMSGEQRGSLTKLLQDGYGFKQVEFAQAAGEKSADQHTPSISPSSRQGAVQHAVDKNVKLRTAKRKETPPARRDLEMTSPLRQEDGGEKKRRGRNAAAFDWGVPKQLPLKLRNDVQKVRENHVIMVYETVHSGQSVAYDGDIVVLGDVNQGAELIASGSIVVMGVLRGMAHAGSAGDETASVSANRLIPQQLRIGTKLAVAPDNAQDSAGTEPERAFVEENRIVIQYLGQKRTRKRH